MKLEQYLHLYLGCDCVVAGHIQKLTGISYDGTQNTWWAYFDGVENCYALVSETNPILRQLSNMTEDEAQDLMKQSNTHTFIRNHDSHYKYTAQQLQWLLSKGFDVFGLIESGIALDKIKIQNQQHIH